MSSAGGSGPYLAMRARLAKGDRAAVERAAFDDRSIVEVPTLRECTMFVPKEERALALHCARAPHEKRLAALAATAGVGAKELEPLAKAIRKALEKGALSPDALRERLAPSLVRPLGEEGRKLGWTSTLTAALKHLQVRGQVQRFAEDRRVDSSRFVYEVGEAVEADSGVDLAREIAARVLRWGGPASVGEIAFWSGSAQKAVKPALEALGAVQIGVAGWANEAWVLPEDAAALEKAATEDDDDVRALPFRDNYLGFRRDPGAFVSPEAADARVLDWNGRPATLGSVESVHHHVLVAGGRIVGIWDFDPEEKRVVAAAVEPLSKSLRARFDEEVAGLERFARDELGDVRYYALDHPRQRAPRIEAVRALGKRSR